MLTLSRRLLLRALPISAVALAIPAAIEAAAPVDPQDRLRAAIDALKLAAAEAYPNIDRWHVALAEDAQHSVPLIIMGHVAAKPAPFTGPGVYEFRLLDDSERGFSVCPTAFLDTAPGRVGWFRWQHYYRGKFQGRGHIVPANRIWIIGKREALGG